MNIGKISKRNKTKLQLLYNTTGTNRGRNARIVGNNGCSDQNNNNTGNRNGNKSARFVVRP